MTLFSESSFYQGKKLQQTQSFSYAPPADDFTDKVKEKTEKQLSDEIAAYFPSTDLVKAVNYARLLKRPLLVQGEPGCGKTRLAQAIAYELYEKDYHTHYFEWHIKSNTKVNDGLYMFDHLARFRDSQQGLEKAKEDYRTFGPLGKALLAATADQPSVLLIDEIDKADLDFPNDLLLELDQQRFIIPDTNEEFTANHTPIIIITSNDEKDLPNAFLRRCVYYYIDFPSPAQLTDIIKSKAQAQVKQFAVTMPDLLLENIAERFIGIREKLKQSNMADKLPSTGELLDWLRIIHYYYFTDQTALKLSTEGKLPDEVLFPEVLFKTLDDYKTSKR
ncbi:MAG: MoxR family ATPase [Spirosomataceae bacterium]